MNKQMNKEINKHKLRISAYVIDDNYSKPQNAPGRNHDQSLSRLWHFCGRNGEFTFFQRRLQPLYFSRSPPARPTQPSLPFCAGVWFSRDSIHAFNKSNLKKQRAVNSLQNINFESTVQIFTSTLWTFERDHFRFTESFPVPGSPRAPCSRHGLQSCRVILQSS